MKTAQKLESEVVIKTTSGLKFEIPYEGNLGLLALGDIGLLAWRQKKLAHNNQKPNQDSST